MRLKRESGIDCISDLSWGAHFCNIYLDINELIGSIVPYLRAGLTHNESCIWVLPSAFDAEKAKNILSKHIPGLEQYLTKGQIEIFPNDRWYVIDGVFNKERVLEAWMNKLDDALASGYDGLRVTGGMDWVEKKDWDELMAYEEKVNNTIGKCKMIAVCNYWLLNCDAVQISEAMLKHQFSIFNVNNAKKVVADSNNSSIVTELKRKNSELETLNRVCMGREQRIIELKQEIERLKKKNNNKP